MKRAFAWLLSLCLLLPLGALGEGADTLWTATVQPRAEIALKAPASGELAAFDLHVGDAFRAGDALFTVEPVRVYAPMDGVISGVRIKAGDIADAAVSRYGAVIQLSYPDPYQLECNLMTGTRNAENRDISVGMAVYLRNRSGDHHADGEIVAVNGQSFTVQVIGGDLSYTQDVYVYRTSEYTNTVLMARSNLSKLAPYAITASGTITEVSVKAGDAVKTGDPLFSYVPDTLDPIRRGKADATVLKAECDLVLTALSATQGASVQKGQVLATAYQQGDLELRAMIDESDLQKIALGDELQVTFEELDLPATTATVTAISALGEGTDASQYEVRLAFGEIPQGTLAGMHVTIGG